MKLVGSLLSLLLMITTVPGFSAGNFTKKGCDNGFSSTLVLTSQEGNCFNYQLTVNYDGLAQTELSSMIIEVPCGTVRYVSNDMKWPIEQDIRVPKLHLSGFKIDNIAGFGFGNSLNAFTVNFSLCATELTCACDLSTLAIQVAYQLNEVAVTGDNFKKRKPKKKGACTAVENLTVAARGTCPLKPLTPILECVDYDTARGTYIAHFGYNNESDEQITIPTGRENKVSPGRRDQGQPTTFTPGRQTDVIQIEFKGDQLTWEITGPDGNPRSAIATTDPALQCASDPVGPVATLSTIDGLSSIQFCSGEKGTLNIAVSGNAPWHVTYTNGSDTLSVNIDASPYALGVTEAGTYTLVSVTDAEGIAGTVTGMVEAFHYEVPTGVISGGGAICDQEFATINFELTGTAPWNVTYTDGKNIYNETISTATHQFQTSRFGTYTLLDVSDANCSGMVSGSATVSMKAPVDGMLYIDPQYCMGKIIYLSSSVRDNGYTYLWTTTGNGQIEFANASKARYKTVIGDSDISFTLHINNGCNTSEVTASTTILNVDANYTISPIVTDGQLTANSTYSFSANTKDGDQYEWLVSDGTAASTSAFDHIFTATGYHTVSLAVWKNGCYSKTLQRFDVVASSTSTVYVANTLSTASTDGGDAIKVYGENIAEDNFSFEIYDRWGLRVYATNDLNEAQTLGWKGQSTGQNNGVYAYILKGRFKNGKGFVKTGRILLAR